MSLPYPTVTAQDRGGGKDPSKQRREPDIEDKVKIAKTPYELMRMRLEYLQEHIDKPAPIPAPKKERAPPKPLEFVRNVVGSSAGAGSAEYHIYRNNRKKEINRLDFLEKKSEKERLEQEFAERVERHKHEAEQKTAKRRAKRQRAKDRLKRSRNERREDSNSDEDDSDSDEDVSNRQSIDKDKESGSKLTNSAVDSADKCTPKEVVLKKPKRGDETSSASEDDT